MRILSIETSGRTGSIALLDADQGPATLRGETHLAGSQRTAQLLAPAIKDLLAEVGWPAGSIDHSAAADLAQEIGDVALAVLECVQDLQPRRVGERLQAVGDALEHVAGRLQRQPTSSTSQA